MGENWDFERLFDEPTPETESGEYSEYDKAFNDVYFLDSTKAAKALEERIIAEGLSLEQVAASIAEIDARVGHLLHGSCIVSGPLQNANDGDESPFTSYSNTPVQFKGYDFSLRDGRTDIDLVFMALADKDGALISIEQATAVLESHQGADTDDTGVHTVHLQARPSEVLCDFAAMHPVRARAILELAHPEVIEAIDARIITPEGATDTGAILGLRGYSLSTTEGMTEPVKKRLTRAVDVYTSNILTIDTDVPFKADIHGVWYQYDEEGAMEPRNTQIEGGVFSLSSLDFLDKSDEPERGHRFWVQGLLHGADSDDPAEFIVLPVDSLASLESLRVRS